jgi:hypothetical protein
VIAQWKDRRERSATIREWYKGREKIVITDWCMTFLRRERTRLGLPRDESQWPDPRQLPTLWAREAARLARIFLKHRDGRRVDGNDFVDWLHYQAAVHADVFVTSDKKLTAIAQECPPPKPNVVTFDAWAGDLLR